MKPETDLVPAQVMFEDVSSGLVEAIEWVRGSVSLPVTSRELTALPATERNIEYAVLYTETTDGWKATVPDLPDCEAIGDSLEEAQNLIRYFIGQRLREMKARGETPPPIRTRSEQASIAA